MTELLTKRSAARSAARQSKRKETSPPPPAVPSPAGVIKTTPRGTRYRIYNIPLMDLPAFLAREGFEAKLFFEYPPEGDYVLGVRRKGETEEREL